MLKWPLLTFNIMKTYYTLLDISIEATAEEVEAAYRRLRERYSPERVTALGGEFRDIAESRTAELDRAYRVLADPQQRRDYDRSLGIAPPSPASRAPGRARLSGRELGLAIGGALAGLIVIALVWALSGRVEQPVALPIAETNRPAPDFSLPGLDGTTVRLSDYRGKIVLVNFWGSWCEPCKEETPALQSVYQKLRDQGLVIIGVDLRNQERSGPDGDADVRNFAGRYGVTYPIALDIAGETGRAFQVYVLPTSFFIDQTGTIRRVSFSTVTAADVEAVFKKLQQEASALH